MATITFPGPTELEADLETFFHARIRAVGGITLKLMPTRSGAPDRLVLFPGGRIALVELKRTAGKPSPIQLLWHARAADIGHTIPVLKGRGEILAWIRDQCDEACGEAPATPTTYARDVVPVRAYLQRKLAEAEDKLAATDPDSAWGRRYRAEIAELGGLL